jgi:Xaa-Pro aminopeptidase
MNSETLLMVADSEHDANMLYAVGMFVPDPFIYLRNHGRDYRDGDERSGDRPRPRSKLPIVASFRSAATSESCGVTASSSPASPRSFRPCCARRGIRRVVVPAGFSLRPGSRVAAPAHPGDPRPGNFFPKRETKSAAEVRMLSAALLMAEIGMSEAVQVLHRAKIAKDRRLLYHDVPLTSEKLRSVIDTAILQAGGLARHTIVAGGKQGCDPHEEGYGPLRANEPIILDIFPRSQKTGYFGDITRTVVRGRASEAVRKVYDTVLQGQKLAFNKMRPECRRRKYTRRSWITSSGQVIAPADAMAACKASSTAPATGWAWKSMSRRAWDRQFGGQTPGWPGGYRIEPGLYYPEIGGVRLEDVALVTGNGARNLTRFEKVLEL